MIAPFLVRHDAQAIIIRVKAVPGARSNAIAGVLGDRLKVRIAAPPEGGRANEAIIKLLADALGIAPKSVTIVAGHASAEKQVRIEGLAHSACDRLVSPEDS